MSSALKHRQRSRYSYRNDELLRAFHCSEHKVFKSVSEVEKSFFKKFFSSLKRFFLERSESYA